MSSLPSLSPRRLLAALALTGLGVLCAVPAAALAQSDGGQHQALSAAAQGALKQKLTQRLPNLPPITTMRTTPIPGLVEVQAGQHVFYVDAKGDHVIEGNLVETRTQRNLTEEVVNDLNRIDFAALPLKDAVVWKNGSGARKLVVFADPNCGYCKQLERSLQQVKDVTVYTFVVPILGDDSRVKADNIWCVKDRTQAWRDWMLSDKAPAKAFGMCTTPSQRNVALAQKYRINGTPALIFEDGTRIPSAAPVETIEQRLARASSTRSAN